MFAVVHCQYICSKQAAAVDAIMWKVTRFDAPEEGYMQARDVLEVMIDLHRTEEGRRAGQQRKPRRS